MSAYQTIAPSPPGIVLRLAAILLLAGQIAAFLLALRQRRGAAYTAATLLHLLFGLAFLTVLLDGAYRLEYLPYLRAYPPVVQALYRLPWPAIAGLELLSALALALCAASRLRFARRHLSPHSIKQTVDYLPTGVCVSAADGTVLLSNVKMSEWCRLLTGSALSDANALRRAVLAHGREQGGRRLVFLENGMALLFGESALELDGQRFVQLTAEDVTEQYRVTKELEEKNARLRDLQYRLKTYQVQENELLLRRELLAARTTVHNQLGGALLTGKYHLEHPESTDPETLRLMLWQINTYLLSEAEDPEPRSDEFASALQLAKGIGVSVELTGAVPEKGMRRALLGQAIRECAANTVKHAGGDRLRAEVGAYSFRITNTGLPPAGSITPSGGLRSLQLAVEQAGGAMQIESRPSFALTVTLPPEL